MPLIPEAGGTERITSLVAKGLTESGHKCMGILEFKEGSETMAYDGKPVTDLYTFLKENHVDVVINQIAYSTWLLSDFLIRGGNRWHAEGGRIISCLHFDPCNPSMLFMVKSQGVHSVKDYVKLAKSYLLHFRNERIKRTDEGKVYNYIYDNSEAFVILSDSHRPYLKKVMSRNDDSKLVTINNPLTFDGIASKKSLDDKKKEVLVCARMSEYHKRISLILKTWKRLQKEGVTKGWILKLVGEGPDLERYKKYAEINKLHNVVFCGRQNPLPYYQEASILFLASSAEGWGLSITEALQNGTVPIVMNSSPVYSDIIDNCYNGYLTPNNNIASFARHCKALMTDPRRLRAMQENSITSAAQKFSIDNIIQKWENTISCKSFRFENNV